MLCLVTASEFGKARRRGREVFSLCCRDVRRLKGVRGSQPQSCAQAWSHQLALRERPRRAQKLDPRTNGKVPLFVPKLQTISCSLLRAEFLSLPSVKFGDLNVMAGDPPAVGCSTEGNTPPSRWRWHREHPGILRGGLGAAPPAFLHGWLPEGPVFPPRNQTFGGQAGQPLPPSHVYLGVSNHSLFL